MRIAVDTRLWQESGVGGYFIKEVFFRLASLHHKHQFIFLFDQPAEVSHFFHQNVTTVVLTPKPTNFLLFKWWYDVKVPLALKKHKADIFICTVGLCSLNTKIPQLLIVQSLAFIHNTVFFNKDSLLFYKKYTIQFLEKAAVIAAFSDSLKKEIVGKYAISTEKISVTSIAARSFFKPLQWEEREKVKDKYAQGCEYFLFSGSLHPVNNLINLLKAFSIFKKWQKTNMKLVIAGNITEYKAQAGKLKSYKYKNEIHLAENLSAAELAQVTAAAYATVFSSSSHGFELAVIEAMQCGVPVITPRDSSMEEIGGDAVLYADLAQPEEVAAQMKHIFKDEQLRTKLIAAGQEQVKAYNWDKTLSLTWQAIEKAVSK